MSTPVNITEKGNLLSKFLFDKMQLGDFTNDDLVQFIELAGMFLNLKTITQYKECNKMSYNGVKNHRYIKEIFNVKFVIDNE
jgi:hypothetical protein